MMPPFSGFRNRSKRLDGCHLPFETLEPRWLLSTTSIAVVNPDFATFYKPGSTTVTAIVPANDLTNGLGPGVAVVDQATGQSAAVTYSDGTRGTTVDVPGWVAAPVSPFSPPARYVGVLGNAPGATQPPPAGTQADALVVGNYPQGEQITQTLGASLLPNTTYVLSVGATAQVNGGAAPPGLVIGLEAGQTLLQPDSSSDPSPEGAGGTVSGNFTRTYNTRVNPPGGPVTIVLGVNPEANGTAPSADFSAVHLTASNSAPGAVLVAPAVTAAGGTSETVTATYTSGAPQTSVNLTSITPANLVVSGPGGQSLTVTGVMTNPTTGSPASVTATYTVAAPAGGWSAADNGTYAVSLSDRQVTDSAGTAAPATTTTFDVSVLPAGLTAGSADPTFAPTAGGRVPLGFSGQASAVAPNGSILVVGQQLVPADASGTPAAVHAALARLNADGTPDLSFGDSGVVTDAATSDEDFYDVLPLPDGRVIVSGSSGADLLLARYNADGTPDATFGTGGRVTVAIPGTTAVTYALAVDPNSGAVVVGGSAGGQFLLDRFTASGAPDPTFNRGQPLQLGSPSAGNAIGQVVILADGRIVAAGAGGTGSTGGSVVALRVNADGTPDLAFGFGGIAAVTALDATDLAAGVHDFTVGLALQSDGKILVDNHTPGGDVGLARLNADGSLDNTFGTGGLVVTDLGGADDADYVGIQPDGQRILVAGTTNSNGVTQSAVLGYTFAGALDPTFGTGGKTLLPFGAPASSVSQVPVGSPAAAGSVSPQDQNVAPILVQMQRIFAALRDRTILVGASDQSDTNAASSLARLVTTGASEPLPAGTLAVTVSAKLPASVVAGAKANVPVTVTIRNPTSQTVSGPVTVTLFVSPAPSLTGATQLLAKTVRVRLKPGKSQSIRLRVAALPAVAAGTYNLLATAKAPDGTTTGVAGPATSIQAAFVSVKVSNLRGPASAVAAGKGTTVTLTLTDSGNQAVSGTATLTVIGTLASPSPAPPTPMTLGTQALKVKLKAGQTMTRRVKVTLPRGLTAGSYSLAATLNVAVLGDAIAADGVATAASPLVVK